MPAGRRSPACARRCSARAGFFGPRTVFEGVHGLFHGFAHTTKGDYDALTGDFGERWVTETLAFKPYPCGTMAHPYIDCARRLAAQRHQGRRTSRRSSARWPKAPCTGCGSRSPPSSGRPTAMPAKFSTPFLLAAGFVHGGVGLDAFTDEAVRDPAVLALAAKVRYVIDPDNPYPNNFTGHIRADAATTARVVEERQPHIRGGAHEPLTRADIEEKFVLNARHGGWDDARAASRRLQLMRSLYDGRDRL